MKIIWKFILGIWKFILGSIIASIIMFGSGVLLVIYWGILPIWLNGTIFLILIGYVLFVFGKKTGEEGPFVGGVLQRLRDEKFRPGESVAVVKIFKRFSRGNLVT